MRPQGYCNDTHQSGTMEYACKNHTGHTGAHYGFAYPDGHQFYWPADDDTEARNLANAVQLAHAAVKLAEDSDMTPAEAGALIRAMLRADAVTGMP